MLEISVLHFLIWLYPVSTEEFIHYVFSLILIQLLFVLMSIVKLEMGLLGTSTCSTDLVVLYMY